MTTHAVRQVDIREGIVQVLSSIPGLRRVYEYAPATVADVPCAIVMSSTIRERWGATDSGGGEWDWRVVVLTHDAKVESAHRQAEEFRDDVRLALRQSIKLGVNNVYVSGPTFSSVGDDLHPQYLGFEVTVPVEVSEAVEFAI